MGSRLVVVDPRRTWLADRADVWLRLRPGTDGALAMAFLNHVLHCDTALLNEDFTDRYVSGLERVREQVRDWTVSRASSECGPGVEEATRAVELYAGSHPSSLVWGVSIDMSRSAIGTAHALSTLVAITGNLDIPGGNIFARDPFGIPRRGVPHELFERLEGERIGADRYPIIRTGFPYAHADCLLDQMESGESCPIRGAWVQGTNTLVSSLLPIPPESIASSPGSRQWWHSICS